MDVVTPQEHLCYVRCAYCNTVLAVGVPCRRMMDTVTVKCGHCNSLSYLNPRPLLQSLSCSNQHINFQGQCNEFRKGQQFLPSSSTSSEDISSPKAPFVVKPPEKKHRLPSAYNRFMREEIQRIKTANPEMPHREAFSTAAKNWAKCEPRGVLAASASSNIAHVDKDLDTSKLTLDQEKTSNGYMMNSFDVFKQMDHRMEEIQRIKTANPEMPHHEAFSTVAKNWAKCEPRGVLAAPASSNITHVDKDLGTSKLTLDQEKTSNGYLMNSFDIFKQMDRRM